MSEQGKIPMWISHPGDGRDTRLVPVFRRVFTVQPGLEKAGRGGENPSRFVKMHKNRYVVNIIYPFGIYAGIGASNIFCAFMGFSWNIFQEKFKMIKTFVCL